MYDNDNNGDTVTAIATQDQNYKIRHGRLMYAEQKIKPIVKDIWLPEMVGNGWLPPGDHGVEFSNPAHRYIVCKDNKKIVSLLLYEVVKDHYIDNFIEIHAAWTDVKYRRQKLYSLLFASLVEYAKKNKYYTIESGFHKDNKVSKLMQRSQGREFVKYNDIYIRTIYRISG